MIRLGNYPDREIEDGTRNINSKSFEHRRSMNSISNCTGISSRSISKEILKVVCQAIQMGFESRMWTTGWELLFSKWKMYKIFFVLEFESLQIERTVMKVQLNDVYKKF